jgi:hypothetical protein
MLRRSLASCLSLAALTAVAVTAFGSAASAHAGNHANMTFGELADHLAASMDHKLTIMVVVLLAVVTGVSLALVRRTALRRPPEKSVT